MPINITRINQKIAAIQAKDVAAITASKTYIPELGYNYTEEQLQAWLDARVQILEWAKTRTTSIVGGELVAIRNALGDSDRIIANALINRELNINLNEATPEGYFSLIKIALLIFAMD